MAPPTTNWHDLCSLATLLRDSGDRVLSGDSKLRLTPALLFKLNSAFSSISLLSSGGDFQVTSAHASQPPTTAQVHFLHDFVQKTIGLTIAGKGQNQSDFLKSQPVDLSRFRSVRHLELRSCTISNGSEPDQGLEGLSSLRTQLEALVLIQVYHPGDLLWAVMADGAVSIGPDVIWTKLSQLVVSYCGLRSFGRGLYLACNLQWVDVSHNMLSDADAISSSLATLPRLCYLNLSYNRLTRVPVPSHGPACPVPTKLQILLLSHNYIETLDGLGHLTCLKELNLEVNQLQNHSSLLPLRSLYQLQHIKLKGNPLSYHKHHRLLASSYMPPRAVFLKHQYRRDAVKLIPFMLDGQKLSESELQAVRNGASEQALIEVSMTESDNRTGESPKNSGPEMERSITKKTRKVREAIIADFDIREELDDSNLLSNAVAQSFESSGEHLQTKRQLENVKAHFKDDWLRAHAGSTVHELLGLGLPVNTRPLSTSTPLPPLSLENAYEKEVLESIILKRSPENAGAPEASQASQSSQYHTANESDTVLHISSANDDTLCHERGPFLSSEVGYDADEDEDIDDLKEIQNDLEDLEGGDSSKYLVTKISQSQLPPTDMFLVTNSRYIKEINLTSGSIMQHWRLCSLESCVLLSASPCQVQLTFNTVVPSKKKRVYQMDLMEAQNLLIPCLKAILESRSLSALNVAAFRCMHCSGEFSIEKYSRKESKVCPFCGSTLVFEQDDAPLPSLGSRSVREAALDLDHSSSDSDSSIESRLDALAALVAKVEACEGFGPRPSFIIHRSAVSLESPGHAVQAESAFVSHTNAGMRRCESDIDIISNPSQSSIEILDDASRTSGTPGRKRSSEERQVVAVPSLVTVPEVSNPLSPLPSGLTESSSSGSVTDSVCTAYENNTGVTSRRGAPGLAKSVLIEESSRENSPRFQEEPEKVESAPQPTSLLDSLLQTMSSKISASENLEKEKKKKIGVPDNIVQYNYTDFSSVDHRLKLHLHLSILDADEREVIQFLLRGEVVTSSLETCYPGILLISSQKVYVMKITGPEEGDEVDRWISRTIAVPREKLQSITALPWGTGMWLALQGAPLSNLIIVLRDQEYTKNAFNFLNELDDEPAWKILKSTSDKHLIDVSECLQDIVKNGLPDADLSLKLAVLLKSSTISKDGEDQNQVGGLLLVTATSILLNTDDFTWLMPSEMMCTRSSKIQCVGKQSISNLIQVEADDCGLWLLFLDEAAGGEEIWRLTLQSEAVLQQIVAAIRPHWEELFSVPLQVHPVTNS